MPPPPQAHAEKIGPGYMLTEVPAGEQVAVDAKGPARSPR